MQIREGAYYRTRDGDVVGPMRLRKDQSWYSCYHQWNEDGGIFSSGSDHGLDLISEVYASDTPPAEAPALETKTLRDEFAMAALSGMLADPDTGDVLALVIGKTAYEYADAMMEARKK